jgi:hypothetical protein
LAAEAETESQYQRAVLGGSRLVKIAHLAREGQAIEQEIESNQVKQSAVKLGTK